MKIDLINSHPDELEGGKEKKYKPAKQNGGEFSERTSQETSNKESNKTIRKNRKAKETNKEIIDNDDK